MSIKKIFLTEVKKGSFFLDPLNRKKKNFIKLNTINSISEHKLHSKICKKVVLKLISDYFKNCKKNFKHKKKLNFFTIVYQPIFTLLVESFYFKYVFLKKINKKEFTLEKVDIRNLEELKVNQFTKLLRTSDKLNSSIIKDIGKKIGVKFFDNHHEFFIENNICSLKEYFLDKLKISLSFLSIQISSLFYKDKIFIHDSVIKTKKIFKILLLSKFKISYLYLSKFTNYKSKKKLNLISKEKNGIFSFQKICSQLIERYLPISYNFSSIKKIKILKIKKGTILITKNLSSPENINFRSFLAENIENLKIYSLQHGGGYGYLKNFYLENYEKSISKKFLTWGWKRDKKDVVFSTDGTKSKKNFFQNNNKILFIGSNFCKYDYRLSAEPNSSLIFNNSKYIYNKKKLFKEITKNHYLIYKPHEVNNWFEDLIDKKKYKNFSIDKNNNLLDLASRSKLIIICHLSTAFLETLNLNKPLMLFLEKNFYNFTNIAKKDFKNLEKIGILHSNINSIKVFLKKKDIQKWWMDSRIQKVREEFLSKYYHTEKNYDKKLLRYLLK